jgi:hypothetical protein
MRTRSIHQPPPLQADSSASGEAAIALLGGAPALLPLAAHRVQVAHVRCCRMCLFLLVIGARQCGPRACRPLRCVRARLALGLRRVPGATHSSDGRYVCDRCVGSSVRSEQRSPKASRFALTRSPLNLNPNLLAPPRSPPSPRTIMSEHASFDWLGLHRVARPRCCDRTGPAAGGGQHVPDRRGVRGPARGRSRCDAQGSISHPGRSVAQNKTSTHTKSMFAESQRCALSPSLFPCQPKPRCPSPRGPASHAARPSVRFPGGKQFVGSRPIGQASCDCAVSGWLI